MFSYNIFSFAVPSTPTKKSAAGSIVVTVFSSDNLRSIVTVLLDSEVSIPVEPPIVTVSPDAIADEPESPATVQE